MSLVVSGRISDKLEQEAKEYLQKLNEVNTGRELNLSDLVRYGLELVVQKHVEIKKDIVNIKVPRKILTSSDLKDIWTILNQVETDATAEGFDAWQDVDAIRLIQESKNQLLEDIKRVQGDELLVELHDLINKREKEASKHDVSRT